MTDHFDAWINSMSNDEYEEMLDDDNPWGFSDAQEEKALNIRTPPTPKDETNLDDLQSGGDGGFSETVTEPSIVSSETPIEVRPIQPEIDARPVREYQPTDYSPYETSGEVSESLPSGAEIQTNPPEYNMAQQPSSRPQRPTPQIQPRREPVPEKPKQSLGDRVRNSSIFKLGRKLFGGG